MTTPKSLGEYRALMENDCTKWAPREFVQYVLREMDAGRFNPDGLVMCYFERGNGNTTTGMKRSNATVMEAVAMVEMAKHDLLAMATE